jgi:hypothetical protein
MDFSHNNRTTQPGVETPGGISSAHVTDSRGKHSKFSGNSDKWLRLASVVLLFSITVLLVAVAFSFYFGGSSESKYLQSGAFQAVDISVGGSSNGDQIYFGSIKDLNSKYLVLDNVYYIPSSTSGSNVSLEPLVCQIDMPYNRMVVNRSSVNWWENLQSTGQVAKAITNYQKTNPKGPTCPKTSATSAATSTTPTTNTSTPATTNSSTATTP